MLTRMMALLLTGSILVACGTADVSGDGEANSEVIEAGTTAEEPGEAGSSGTVTDDEPGEDGSSAVGAGEESGEADAGAGTDESGEQAADRLDIEVVESGFSTFVAYDDSTRASWAAIVSNPNGSPWLATSIDLTVTMLDDQGSVLASESDSLAVLLPGQSGAVTGTTLDDVDGLTDLRVQARVRDWERAPGPYGSFETSDITVRQDDFGGWSVTGQVASTFTEDFEDVYGVAVFRDAEDRIVGGAFTFIDFVPGGGDTSFQIDSFDDIEQVASSEVYVSLSNLSLW